MPKGREFVLRVNNPDRDINDERVDEKVFEDRVSRIHTLIMDSAQKAFVGVCIYVVLDTIRQVLVARNTSIYD
jgi:hypothetical protein